MSWIEHAASVVTSLVGSGVLVALVNRYQKRDVLEDGRAREERREETASHKREERREAQLHDECRKEVAGLRDEVAEERDARLALAASVARCEERHAAAEERNRISEQMHAERHAANEARIARLERRSNPPIPMSPEPAE